MKSQWEILVVDDEEIMRESLASWLREDGYSVDTASSGHEALRNAREKDYACCFIDLRMPGGLDGIETMMEIRKIHPDAPIIIVTAYATVDTAITAMKEGAQEYVVKPCNPEEISLLVNRIIKVKTLQRENAILRKKLFKQYRFQDLISKNPRMHEIFQLIREIADHKSTVLIHGESGTGKELIARAIHFSGEQRAAGPFVGVSCAALAETLLESELFGYEKGAFTGASTQKKGKFELAHGGTIFLDEIGDISPKLQMDLLRILQERKFYRVGGSEEITVDVRVIAATNSNLLRKVQEGTFRDDLYYRLNVITIALPALRERREDIPLLARHFIERLSHEIGKEIGGISEEGLRTLLDYHWPGNVRELENTIERAVITCKSGVLGREDFAFLQEQGHATPSAGPHAHGALDVPPGLTLAELEEEAIRQTLGRNGGNVKETAASLGIDRSTLYDKLKRYGIERPRA